MPTPAKRPAARTSPDARRSSPAGKAASGERVTRRAGPLRPFRAEAAPFVPVPDDAALRTQLAAALNTLADGLSAPR